MKTHKCPPLAKMQIAEGAVGITFAEISEAQQPGSLSRIAGQYDPGGCVLWANRVGEASTLFTVKACSRWIFLLLKCVFLSDHNWNVLWNKFYQRNYNFKPGLLPQKASCFPSSNGIF